MSGRAPPYGSRANGPWIPRTPADFGDGGAFPEIHAAQYPLGMGEKNEKKEKSNALALQVFCAHFKKDFPRISKDQPLE